MHVHGEITGLTPGEHGFHVHEFGVWNEDGMASGGHFNPTGAPHASHSSEKRHVGDMGNIKADENGKAIGRPRRRRDELRRTAPASSAAAWSCTRRPTT